MTDSYWLFKTEPEVFSWDMLKARGKQGEPWDGVRNFQARNNMRAMKIGDLGFFYHSGEDRKIKQALRGPAGSRFARRLPEIPGVRPPERPWEELTRRVVTPSPAERERNPRARSARLRAFRRTRG